MTNNPYAHPEPQEPGYVEPQRISGLAISSLVLSLICCIPGVSLIGAVLGGISLVSISKSRGRLTGKGLAIAGLILGLLFTFVWFGIVVGVLRNMQDLTVYGQTMQALDQRDFTRVRQVLDPAVSGALTDERLEEFRREVEAEWGSFVRMPQGLGDWAQAYMQALGPLAQQQIQFGDQVWPVPVYYDNGAALVLVDVDPWARSPLGVPQLSNIRVYDRQGNPMWLLPPAAPIGVPAPPLPPEAPPEVRPQPDPAPPPGEEGPGGS